MTQEQKEMLIKDICGRLAYGLKVQVDMSIDSSTYSDIVTVKGIMQDAIFHDTIDIKTQNAPKFSIDNSNIENVKPILFPMRAINQDMEIRWKDVNIGNTIYRNFEHDFYVDSDGDICIEMDDANYVYRNEYCSIIDVFNQYHIDYRNLIGQGLAISALDLSENPYNKK